MTTDDGDERRTGGHSQTPKVAGGGIEVEAESRRLNDTESTEGRRTPLGTRSAGGGIEARRGSITHRGDHDDGFWLMLFEVNGMGKVVFLGRRKVSRTLNVDNFGSNIYAVVVVVRRRAGGGGGGRESVVSPSSHRARRSFGGTLEGSVAKTKPWLRLFFRGPSPQRKGGG